MDALVGGDVLDERSAACVGALAVVVRVDAGSHREEAVLDVEAAALRLGELLHAEAERRLVGGLVGADPYPPMLVAREHSAEHVVLPDVVESVDGVGRVERGLHRGLRLRRHGAVRADRRERLPEPVGRHLDRELSVCALHRLLAVDLERDGVRRTRELRIEVLVRVHREDVRRLVRDKLVVLVVPAEEGAGELRRRDDGHLRAFRIAHAVERQVLADRAVLRVADKVQRVAPHVRAEARRAHDADLAVVDAVGERRFVERRHDIRLGRRGAFAERRHRSLDGLVGHLDDLVPPVGGVEVRVDAVRANVGEASVEDRRIAREWLVRVALKRGARYRRCRLALLVDARTLRVALEDGLSRRIGQLPALGDVRCDGAGRVDPSVDGVEEVVVRHRCAVLHEEVAVGERLVSRVVVVVVAEKNVDCVDVEIRARGVCMRADAAAAVAGVGREVARQRRVHEVQARDASVASLDVSAVELVDRAADLGGAVVAYDAVVHVHVALVFRGSSAAGAAERAVLGKRRADHHEEAAVVESAAAVARVSHEVAVLHVGLRPERREESALRARDRHMPHLEHAGGSRLVDGVVARHLMRDNYRIGVHVVRSGAGSAADVLSAAHDRHVLEENVSAVVDLEDGLHVRGAVQVDIAGVVGERLIYLDHVSVAAYRQPRRDRHQLPDGVVVAQELDRVAFRRGVDRVGEEQVVGVADAGGGVVPEVRLVAEHVVRAGTHRRMIDVRVARRIHDAAGLAGHERHGIARGVRIVGDGLAFCDAGRIALRPRSGLKRGVAGHEASGHGNSFGRLRVACRLEREVVEGVSRKSVQRLDKRRALERRGIKHLALGKRVRVRPPLEDHPSRVHVFAECDNADAKLCGRLRDLRHRRRREGEILVRERRELSVAGARPVLIVLCRQSEDIVRRVLEIVYRIGNALLCDDIFGDENRRAEVVVVRSPRDVDVRNRRALTDMRQRDANVRAERIRLDMRRVERELLGDAVRVGR